MIEFIFYWLMIGLCLSLQHSVRYYLKNKRVLSLDRYTDVFGDSKLFYFTVSVLWIFSLDFLIEVECYE